MSSTSNSKVARSISQAVEPAVQAIATRLFFLTTYRPGSKKHKPTVLNLFETTFVHSIYEHLLMDPTVAHLDIRHEMPCGNERIDLWMRNAGGGPAHLVEVGFYSKKKVEDDLNKMKLLKPSETRWFLALFRGKDVQKSSKGTSPSSKTKSKAKGHPAPKHPRDTVTKSLSRANGLNPKLMTFNQDHAGLFKVYRPGKPGDYFGFALIKGK